VIGYYPVILPWQCARRESAYTAYFRQFSVVL